MDSETLIVERRGGWLEIRLNRPETRNALSSDMVEELTALLVDVAPDRGVRGITLSGAGGVFCAGGDLKSFRQDLQATGARQAVIAASERAGALFHRLNTMPQFVTVLVEGAAMAGGLGLVCAADAVAVTRDAQFAFTEIRLGIAPAQIAPYAVARFGRTSARRLMLSGGRFDGVEAGRLGLADRVADDAEGLADFDAALRAQVLAAAPGAVAATKALILGDTPRDAAAARRHAAEVFADGLLGDEGREGIAAFLGKRRPAWSVDGDR
jgi:isohexenylglutaconyl-CoA hydratase